MVLYPLLLLVAVQDAPPSPPPLLLDNDLPEGSGFATDDTGRFTDCRPPQGQTADEAFTATCRRVIERNAAARRLLPIDRAAWVDASVDPREPGETRSGSTTVRADVDAEGKVLFCRIVTSSGDAALDEASCRIMATRARFMPARNGDGTAIPALYQTRFNW